MPAKKERTEYIILRPGMKFPKGKTDWARFDATTEEEIAQQAASDPDTAPLPDDDWLKHARWVMPDPKIAISIRLDPDVLDWFRKQGARYQSRINAVLRAYVSAHAGRVPKARAARKARRKKAGGKS